MRSWWVFVFLSVAASMAFSAYVIMIPWPHEAEERALCDRSVKALLTSEDLVEVTRAGIITDRLNCSIGRRLSQAATGP